MSEGWETEYKPRYVTICNRWVIGINPSGNMFFHRQERFDGALNINQIDRMIEGLQEVKHCYETAPERKE